MVKTGGCCFQAVQLHNMLWKICRELRGAPKNCISCLYFAYIFTFFIPASNIFFIFIKHFKAVFMLEDSIDPVYTAACTVGIVLCSCDRTQHVWSQWLNCWAALGSNITSSHAHIQALKQRKISCPPFIYPHPNTFKYLKGSDSGSAFY